MGLVLGHVVVVVGALVVGVGAVVVVGEAVVVVAAVDDRLLSYWGCWGSVSRWNSASHCCCDSAS